MTAQFASVDELLETLYHQDAAGNRGRAVLGKVLDAADAYCVGHPQLMATDRRKLLHARLRIIDQRLRVSLSDAIQASLLNEPRYLVVAVRERVNVEVAEVIDWDAAYGIELDDYVTRVAAHQRTVTTYGVVRSAWQPGERLPDVLRRLRAQGGLP